MENRGICVVKERTRRNNTSLEVMEDVVNLMQQMMRSGCLEIGLGEWKVHSENDMKE